MEGGLEEILHQCSDSIQVIPRTDLFVFLLEGSAISSLLFIPCTSDRSNRSLLTLGSQPLQIEGGT